MIKNVFIWALFFATSYLILQPDTQGKLYPNTLNLGNVKLPDAP